MRLPAARPYFNTELDIRLWSDGNDGATTSSRFLWRHGQYSWKQKLALEQAMKDL
jgi:hypothetical protein